MVVHYRTQGFIIKKTDRGEANQLLTIYTKDFGKLEILGKAIRKIKSKLRGGTDLFYLSEIEFIQGKAYKTLTDAILIESFPNIRRDLEKLALAQEISKSLDNLVGGEEKDDQIWQLLKESFLKLNSLEGNPMGSSLWVQRNLKLEIIYYCFLWNLLSILGYQPELYNCSICQKKLATEALYFSQEGGGVVCGKCFKRAKKAEKINQDFIKILRLCINKNWQILSKLKIDSESQKLLKKVSQNYYFQTLGKDH